MTDRKVLVPLDNEPLSVQTIKSLIALKKNLTAPLTLLHVLDVNRLSCRGLAEKGIKEIKEHARS